MTDTRTRNRIQFLVREIHNSTCIINNLRSRITLANLAGLQPVPSDVRLLTFLEAILDCEQAELAALTSATTEQETPTP
jgi:hypothetical protein